MFHLICQIKKIYDLSWQERKFLLLILGLAGLIRAAILLFPFKWIALFLGKRMVESSVSISVDEQANVQKIAKYIALISRYTPWQSTCLVQAVIGKLLLRYIGLSNTLYLGVGRIDDKLVAHAWLRCGPLIVTGGIGYKHFNIVGKFADLDR